MHRLVRVKIVRKGKMMKGRKKDLEKGEVMEVERGLAEARNSIQKFRI